MQTCWTVFCRRTPQWKADLSDQVPWEMFLQNWREQVMGNSFLTWKRCLTRRTGKRLSSHVLLPQGQLLKPPLRGTSRTWDRPWPSATSPSKLQPRLFKATTQKTLMKVSERTRRWKHIGQLHVHLGRNGQQSRLSHRSWNSCGPSTRREVMLLASKVRIFSCKIFFPSLFLDRVNSRHSRGQHLMMKFLLSFHAFC